jgi:hypothetical protein
MRFVQFRLAKRNGELVQQSRIVISTTTSKWYKPWDTQTETYESEWQDVPIPDIDKDLKFTTAGEYMSDKGYEVGTLEQAEEFAKKRNYANCNGFCGEYECKENQAHCKRLKK